MFKRSIKPLLHKALSRSPVVLLNGARQVGKTTLTREFISEMGYSYFTFDDELTYLSAKSNMTGFIREIPKPVILDEVQRIPEIFLTIKQDVDQHRTPGRYLLTGSANPLLIPKLGDSLAGRMEILNLMPLSQGEILGKEEHFIDFLFSNKNFTNPTHFSKKQLYSKILIGGYPSVVQQDDQENRDAWLRNYINLILQRDIKELAQIEKLTELPNLLKILAARVSGLVNVAELSRDSHINVKTLHRYIALFETLFLISFQPPWSTNLSLRFIKSPKLSMVDSGLLAYLLNISLESAPHDTHLMGRILENFIVGELRKQATWNKKNVNLYHFRTADGEEVDIILEDRSGNIVGIEIKHNEKVTPHDFKGLTYLQEKVGERCIKGIVLYTGTQVLPFGERQFAVPIHTLWE